MECPILGPVNISGCLFPTLNGLISPNNSHTTALRAVPPTERPFSTSIMKEYFWYRTTGRGAEDTDVAKLVPIAPSPWPGHAIAPALSPDCCARGRRRMFKLAHAG
jgi:hypothetical protein